MLTGSKSAPPQGVLQSGGSGQGAATAAGSGWGGEVEWWVKAGLAKEGWEYYGRKKPAMLMRILSEKE